MKATPLRLAPLLLLLAPIAFGPVSARAGEPAGLKKPVPTATATATASGTAGIKSNAPPKPTGKLAEGLEALDKADYVEAEKLLKAATGKDVAKANVAASDSRRVRSR